MWITGNPILGVILNFWFYCVDGTVKQQTGPVSFLITLKDGQTVKKHIDQLKASHQEDSSLGDPPPVTPIVSEQQVDFDEFPPEVKEAQPTPPPVRCSKRNCKSQLSISFS